MLTGKGAKKRSDFLFKTLLLFVFLFLFTFFNLLAKTSDFPFKRKPSYQPINQSTCQLKT